MKIVQEQRGTNEGGIGVAELVLSILYTIHQIPISNNTHGFQLSLQNDSTTLSFHEMTNTPFILVLRPLGKSCCRKGCFGPRLQGTIPLL